MLTCWNARSIQRNIRTRRQLTNNIVGYFFSNCLDSVLALLGKHCSTNVFVGFSRKQVSEDNFNIAGSSFSLHGLCSVEHLGLFGRVAEFSLLGHTKDVNFGNICFTIWIRITSIDVLEERAKPVLFLRAEVQHDVFYDRSSIDVRAQELRSVQTIESLCICNLTVEHHTGAVVLVDARLQCECGCIWIVWVSPSCEVHTLDFVLFQLDDLRDPNRYNLTIENDHKQVNNDFFTSYWVDNSFLSSFSPATAVWIVWILNTLWSNENPTIWNQRAIYTWNLRRER
ncbi:hypothetical protein D3C71_1105040 [compost metagenome]